MDITTTKNISIIISLIGILILLLITNIYEINTSKISLINQNTENQKVKIIGKVISKQVYENNFTVFKMKDSTGEISIICNCANIKINQTLEIIGITKLYKNQMQISADKIELIK